MKEHSIFEIIPITLFAALFLFLIYTLIAFLILIIFNYEFNLFHIVAITRSSDEVLVAE
jgi:hypothetical protein